MTIATMSVEPNPRRDRGPAGSWLVGGGKMGQLIRSMDWSKNPLGPIDSWSQSLRTAVGLCVASDFPILLAWGPQRVMIYNDGYRPICGDKHPVSMGQELAECWVIAWPLIKDAFALSLSGETFSLDNQRMFLDRNGFLEETFFTFAFSPIQDESGVAGIFNPTIETTGLILADRRNLALREIVSPQRSPETIEEACELATQTLSAHPRDLPFVLFYLFDEPGGQALLVAGAGLPPGSVAGPALVEIATPSHSTWPLAEVAKSGMAQYLQDVGIRFGHFACGEYPESQTSAMVLPITPSGCDRPLGVLVAGVSPRLALQESYSAFYVSLQGAVTSQVANVRVLQAERDRIQALADANRAKTLFFANVSHEFRTPLTLMLGPLEDELAERDQPLPQGRRERLQAAHRNSLRLLKLVNTLLDFSRIEAGHTQAYFQPTDLSAYTADLASMFRSLIESAGLTLILDCPKLPRPVYVDREMWEKIVINLLSNAFKHTFTGSIGVTLRWGGDHVVLLVADSGVGIAAAELPYLFARFHQIKAVRSRTHEGTGIGLAMVRELVSLHGGTVQAESQEGKGSTFTIKLKTGVAHLPPERRDQGHKPAVNQAQTAAYLEEAQQWLSNTVAFGAIEDVNRAWSPVPADTPETKRPPRILLADDNPDMRDYLSRLLSGSYDVVAVADGSKALDAALTQAPDLVLTDIMMPGLDGLGLVRELKTSPRTRDIPVLLLSAKAGEEALVEGLNAGADDYLAKPFSAQELLARVRAHLQPATFPREPLNELEQANRDLDLFSYSISHDLRTPLRAIDGFSEALIDEYSGKLDDQACDYLQRIRSGTQRMSTIINDLLALTRVSRSVMRNEPINLSAMARRVVSDLRNLEPARDLDVEIGDGLSAVGDARLLNIVLLNLLGNAFKYTARVPAARVAFDWEQRGQETVFYVRDNGAGFDMAHAGSLFRPFQRLHTDAEFEGSGMGLATAQRVISRHGGRIWTEAAVNAGATFYFTLRGNE